MQRGTIFEVGGIVRDDLMGRPSKDHDFVVVMSGQFQNADEAFAAMRQEMVEDGFQIFTENPEFFTLRAHFPKSHAMFGKTTADIVLARRDGPSRDGRHPDFVEAGSLHDDQARRDLTINSIARTLAGDIIDPFDGQGDIQKRIIRAVGDPFQRFHEDSLRVLRALRFSVTLGFTMAPDLFAAIRDISLPDRLASVSAERKRDELEKMFKTDTLATLDLLNDLPKALKKGIFAGNLRLSATIKL